MTRSESAAAGIPLPDILNQVPCRPGADAELDELLELTFLGKESRRALHEGVYRGNLPPSDWDAVHFATDLFVPELVEACFRISTPRRSGPVHREFFLRLLAHPPRDAATIALRHCILRELTDDTAMRSKVEDAYDDLRGLLDLLKAMRTDGRINTPAFRLDILKHLRASIDRLARDFADSRSGLVRLHEAAVAIQTSEAYSTLAALLDHEANLALVNLDVRVGADGRLRALAVRALSENSGNPFYHPPWRRWASFLYLRMRRYDFDSAELIDQLILSVYGRIAPLLRILLQVICQLEAYLGALGFAAIAGERGLDGLPPGDGAGRRAAARHAVQPAAAARPGPAGPLHHRRWTTRRRGGPGHRPQLRRQDPPAPGHRHHPAPRPVRPVRSRAERRRLPLARGLFVSLVEPGGADAVEGRLGSELLRIRTLFETYAARLRRPARRAVLGHQPLRGHRDRRPWCCACCAELRAGGVRHHPLPRLRPPPRRRRAGRRSHLPPGRGRRATQHSTYQFIPGVASTSMAAGTARRLGVTFEELEELLRRRSGPGGS